MSDTVSNVTRRDLLGTAGRARIFRQLVGTVQSHQVELGYIQRAHKASGDDEVPGVPGVTFAQQWERLDREEQGLWEAAEPEVLTYLNGLLDAQEG